jgi:hypothetical protein
MLDVQELSPRALALDRRAGRLFVSGATGLHVLDTETLKLTPVQAMLDAETPVEHVAKLLLNDDGTRLYALIRSPAVLLTGSVARRSSP